MLHVRRNTPINGSGGLLGNDYDGRSTTSQRVTLEPVQNKNARTQTSNLSKKIDLNFNPRSGAHNIGRFFPSDL